MTSMRVAAILTAAILLARAVAADPSTLIQANTGFALDLHQRVKDADPSGNAFYSPYSISECLAMVYAGAAGNTATQMAAVLHFDTLTNSPHAAFAELDTGLRQIEARGYVRLSVANGLWVQRDYPLLPEFTQVISNNYRSSTFLVNFAENTEATRVQINDWVAANTCNKIRDILRPGALTALTRLVLANTMYFKGLWEIPFDPRVTSNESFILTNGTTTAVPTMHGGGILAYVEDEAHQAIALPYKGGDVDMVVVLPKATNGLEATEATMTSTGLTSFLAGMVPTDVVVSLPKFRVESTFRMSDAFSAMGMTDVFTPGTADLSGIDGTRLLFISAVVHKAFIQIDEAGTEAAASTISDMGGSEPRPMIPFRANHPFLFLIRDTATGSILFIGRVVDPPAPPPYTCVDAACDYFPGAQPAGSDWIYSDWFGFLWAGGFPWVWSHGDQTWSYCLGQGSDSLWLWSSQYDWIWTSPTAHPWCWNWTPQGSRWLWHSSSGEQNVFTEF